MIVIAGVAGSVGCTGRGGGDAAWLLFCWNNFYWILVVGETSRLTWPKTRWCTGQVHRISTGGVSLNQTTHLGF